MKIKKPTVLVLEHNIIYAFEKCNSISLQKIRVAKDQNKVSGIINTCIKSEQLTFPYVGLESRDIFLDPKYLTFLWSYIYSILVIFEEGYQRKLIEGVFDGELKFDNELLIRANDLFKWSSTLPFNFSDWDLKLPNPESSVNSEEKRYSEITNQIFQNSVSFLLFHEFCHLSEGHDEYYLNKDELDIPELIALEKEADQYAFDMMIEPNMPRAEYNLRAFAITMVLSSSLLAHKQTNNMVQNAHPDTDTRLIGFLKNLTFYYEQEEFYFYTLASLGIKLFLDKHDIQRDVHEHEDANSELQYLIEVLDAFKLEE